MFVESPRDEPNAWEGKGEVRDVGRTTEGKKGWAERILLMHHRLAVATWLVAVLCWTTVGRAEEPAWTELFDGKSLDAWKNPSSSWQVVGDVAVDLENPRLLEAKPGKGILYNGPTGKAPNLLSKKSFGDIEISLEFMIPNGSNSGIKFEKVYEIQIHDSWGVKEITGKHMGGIYPRSELLPKYHHIDKGIAPLKNACKRPGEWQTLQATFLTPRKDKEGKLIRPAHLVNVTLNGEVIHDDLVLKTPTGSNWRRQPGPRGQLLVQGDHGPIAFRSIRVRELTQEVANNER
ncbi:hypothetical protein Pan216_34230 [Planctomycetes bacterium Pan216]|uniref:3-keto-alpha-glucoside-1,2-lyase/3-keto-2-hydroxy-glucal hydratase domain-containing protein n=2 Tax=Kolteria novifilia TaxID=2527975 RepID=A0A518B6G4_9BACT|nr:hypothetical protein Pan216_34230 [Planctomycetes bacterium Pan216]